MKVAAINKFVLYTLTAAAVIIGFIELLRGGMHYALLFIWTAFIVYVAYQFLYPLYYTIKNGKLAEIFDRYGYSEEYLTAYKKAKITGKPFDLTTFVQYVEIYVYIGQSEKAAGILGSITLPEKPRRFEMVEFLRVYILALLKSGELEQAEELWSKNSYYINRMETIENYSPNVGSIFLSEIYIECLAASKGDESRLERAHELTKGYIASQKAKGLSHLNGFDIILVYELRALGRTEELDEFYPAALKKVDRPMMLFDFSREMELEALEKARNGVLPFLD